MVIANQKSTIDTHSQKKKESKQKTTKSKEKTTKQEVGKTPTKTNPEQLMKGQ